MSDHRPVAGRFWGPTDQREIRIATSREYIPKPIGWKLNDADFNNLIRVELGWESEEAANGGRGICVLNFDGLLSATPTLCFMKRPK